MTRIVWLASYPKSGNTWLRILLANARSSGQDPVDINALDDQPAFARDLFDGWCGFKSSILPPEVVERLRPDVYRAMARDASDALVLKAHDRWGLTDRGEPVFPADVTRAVVYILRNPLDVVPSAAHHWGVSIEAAVERLADTATILVGDGGSLSTGLPQPIGSWSSHALGWLDESRLPLLLLRYEDLLADPVDSLTRVTRFCGFEAEPQRIRRAVEHARFDRLRSQEAARGFAEHSARAPGRFFRKGTAGGWRDVLPQPLVRRVIDDHGEVMRRFGYLDDKGNPL